MSDGNQAQQECDYEELVYEEVYDGIMNHKMVVEVNFTGHQDIIYSLLYYEEKEIIVSCSRDSNIYIWDIHSGKCLSVLEDHTKFVCHIIKFSTNYKNKKEVEKKEAEDFNIEIDNHSCSEDEIFLSCGDDGKIFAYSLEKMERIKLVFDHVGYWHSRCHV